MSRNSINTWMRNNGVKGQKDIRRASWKHAQLYHEDPIHRLESDNLYEDIGLVHCAMSRQEAQHFTHLVNCTILLLLRPEEAIRLNKQQPYPSPKQIATTADSKDECELYKDLLHQHLWEVVNNYGEQETKTTAVRFQELEERVRRLEQYTGLNEESKNRIQRKTDAGT